MHKLLFAVPLALAATIVAPRPAHAQAPPPPAPEPAAGLAGGPAVQDHTTDPPAHAQPPPGPIPAAPGYVTVHVRSANERTQRRVKLFREPTALDLAAGRFAPMVVCTAVCDTDVGSDPEARFFFDGPGMTSSQRFRLDDLGGEVNVEPKAGYGVMYGVGIALMAAGVAEIVVSAVLGFTTRNAAPTDPGREQVVPSIIGGAGGVAGGAVLFHFGRTRFTIAPPAGARRDVGRIIGEGLLRGGTFSF